MNWDGMNDRKAAFLTAAQDGHDEHGPGGAASTLLRAVVIGQIADGDPPQVWQAAQRLLDAGLEVGDVVGQLAMAFGQNAWAAVEGGSVDRDGYLDMLARLPLPTAGDIERAYIDTVREHQLLGAGEVERLVVERLGRPDDELVVRLLDWVADQVLDDGPLVMLSPDRLVHVPSMLSGVVLTHRLSDDERRSGVLCATDLPGFARGGLTWRGEDILDYEGEDGRSRWWGPSGWLADLPCGAVIAVRVGAGGEVSRSALDDEPAATDALVAALRSAYDTEVAEPWLPVTGEDLLLAALAADRTVFAVPVPPLSELAATAGLERRGEYYAHAESVWRQGELLDRQHRVLDRLGPGRDARTTMRVLSLVDEVGEAGDVAAAREILDSLYDPAVLEVVADELLGSDDDPTRLAEFATLADRLRVAASRPAQQAVAGWLAALAAERDGRVLDAESHLRHAVREDPGWPCAQDRLAWYESDRGDPAAVERWRRLGETAAGNPDLAEAEPFAATAAAGAARLGRNERCWCGSGRKYKACHLGRPVRAPLPDRVGWLCRKAIAYLERRGGVGPIVLGYAAARAGVPNDPDDPESREALAEALADPLVLETVLHEGGWFERFLADRGPLLPDDEAMLARSWTLLERSVHEVLDVRAGQGLVVRDLRTGDRHEVRERSLSRQVTGGALVCARVVPDGETHQLIGGVFGVAPGTEAGLLEVLDRRDGYALLHHVSRLHRPPELVTTDGEPIVDCRAELEVPDPAQARAELDRRYEPDGDGWVSFTADTGTGTGTGVAGGRTVRAWLSLDGQALTVRTMSQPRLDAVRAELLAALPGARVTGEQRRPFEPGPVPGRSAMPGRLPPGAAVGDEWGREALAEIVDRQERAWCDEQVPALGGRTPREAAEDPTRRDELARLIASFPDIDPASGMLGLRPARLRELLGLGGGGEGA